MSNSYQESIDKAKKHIAELKSSLEELHKDILKNATAFRDLLQSTGTSNLKEFNRLVAENNKLSKQNSDLKAKQVEMLKKAEIAEQRLAGIELTNAKKRLAIKDKESIMANRDAARKKKEEQLLIRSASAYNKLDAELKKVSKDFQDLSAKRAQGITLTTKEIGKLNALEARLKILGGAYKRVNRELITASGGVNRASTSFDSLGFSVAQITRESPAFLNSLNTGFMAISNNIPILVDEITKLNLKNKDLIAQGKPTENVLKKVGAAFFSWQSLISASIVALTVFGPKLFEFIGSMREANRTIDAQKEAIKALNESRLEAIKSTSDQISKTKLLFAIAKDVTKTQKERNIAVNELIDSSNGLIKSTERKNILNGEAVKLEKELIKQMIDRATVEALVAKNAELFGKIAENNLKISRAQEKRESNLTTKEFRAHRKRINNSKEFLKFMSNKQINNREAANLDQYLNELQKDKNKLEDQANAIMGEALKLSSLYINSLDSSSNRKRKDKDATLELMKISAEANKKLVEDDEKTFLNRTELLDQLLVRRRLINERILENDLKAAGKNEDLQKLAHAKFIQRLEKNLQEQTTLRNSIQKDQLDDIKENLKAIEDAEKVVRDRKIQEANGDKDKLKEIEKEHFKAVLQLQSNYIAEVLRENENLTEEQINILVAMLTKMGAEMAKAAEKTKNNLKDIQKEFKDIFATVTDTFSNAFGIDTSKFNFIFDELAKSFDKLDETSSELFSKDKLGDWGDAAKEIIGGVLNANLQRYEFQIEAARRARDTILNDELATEEHKRAARRKFEADERRIRTERARQERENTLIQIAVDTAAGVAKVLAQTGAVAPFVIPSIIALGLAQAAFVASQPLPKFATGTMNAPEGLAYTDEKGAELHTDKKGNIKDFGSSKGARIKYLEEGDKIYTASKTKEILSNLTSSELQNAIFNLNMKSNDEILKDNVVDMVLLNEIKGMKSSNEKVWREVKKLAERPINIDNQLSLTDNRPY